MSKNRDMNMITVQILTTLLFIAYSHAAAQPVAIIHVNIIDVEEGVTKPGMSVIVTGDRISAVGSMDEINVPDGAILIDGTGKYIIPGLWDMHAHIVSYDWVLPLLRVNGITGLRSMHGGERIHDINKNRIELNYLGFEFSYSSPIVDGPPGLWPGSLIADSPEEGRVIVRKLHAAGYDFIKVYSNLSRETYFAIAEESRKLILNFAGHVPSSITTDEAIAAGQKSIEHSAGLDFLVQKPDEIQRMIRDRDTTIVNTNGQVDLFKWFDYVLQHHDASRLPLLMELAGGSEIWFCPTLVNLRVSAFSKDPGFTDDDRLKYIPDEELSIWRAPLESGEFPEEFFDQAEWQYELSGQYYHKVSSLLKPMLNSGARFLAGTDIGNPFLFPGFSIHDELKLFVEAGFTPLEALQTATLNPAIYLNRSADLGTVEEGKIANLILLNAKPAGGYLKYSENLCCNGKWPLLRPSGAG
jgi:hypothetical protein